MRQAPQGPGQNDVLCLTQAVQRLNLPDGTENIEPGPCQACHHRALAVLDQARPVNGDSSLRWMLLGYLTCTYLRLYVLIV